MFCDYCGDLLGKRGYIHWEGKACCLKRTCLLKAQIDEMEGLIVIMGQLFGPREGGDGKENKVDVGGGSSVSCNGNDNLYQTLGRRYE